MDHPVGKNLRPGEVFRGGLEIFNSQPLERHDLPKGSEKGQTPKSSPKAPGKGNTDWTPLQSLGTLPKPSFLVAVRWQLPRKVPGVYLFPNMLKPLPLLLILGILTIKDLLGGLKTTFCYTSYRDPLFLMIVRLCGHCSPSQL